MGVVALLSSGCGGVGQTGLAKGSGSDVGHGKQLFVSKCGSCHKLTGSTLVGPTFKGLYGSKVQLSTGQTVTADDAYLLESIMDPDAKIVKGFPKGVMSATIRPGSVPEAKAKQLVAFIKSKK